MLGVPPNEPDDDVLDDPNVEGDVVGVVGAAVMLEESSSLWPVELLEAFDVAAFAVGATVVAFAADDVVPPAWTAMPANAPVAARAPAADHRVNRLTRRSASSRSLRFRTILGGWLSYMPPSSARALWPS